MPRKKKEPVNQWLVYAREIQGLGDKFEWIWNGGGGNWDALKKWLFDIASDRLTDAEKLDCINEAILNYDKFEPGVHAKIKAYLLELGLRQYLQEQYNFYNNLLNPTHVVTNHLPSGTYTKEIKTLTQPQTEAPFKTGIMTYQGFTYWIEGTPPNQYRWVIQKDGTTIDDSTIAPFEKVTDANQSARQRISELSSVLVIDPSKPVEEPPPKRRGRPRKKLELITEVPEAEDIAEEKEAHYTFTPQEDKELVQVLPTEEDW